MISYDICTSLYLLPDKTKACFLGLFNGFAVFQCSVTLLRFASAGLFWVISVHCLAVYRDTAVIVEVTIIRVISVVNRVTLFSVSVFTCRSEHWRRARIQVCVLTSWMSRAPAPAQLLCLFGVAGVDALVDVDTVASVFPDGSASC